MTGSQGFVISSPLEFFLFQLSESTTDNDEEKAKLQKKATRNDNKNQRNHDTGVFENKETKGLTTDEDKAEHEVNAFVFVDNTQSNKSVTGLILIIKYTGISQRYKTVIANSTRALFS